MIQWPSFESDTKGCRPNFSTLFGMGAKHNFASSFPRNFLQSLCQKAVSTAKIIQLLFTSVCFSLP